MSRTAITNEDNMQLMKRYNDDSFQVAFLDPEYGIGESAKNHNSRNTPVKQSNGKSLTIKDSDFVAKSWDNEPPSYDFFREVIRVSEHYIIFGANYFIELVGKSFGPPRRNEFEKFINDNPKGWVIWDKMNGTNDFNDCEMIKTSFDIDSFVIKYMWNGMMQGSKSDGTIPEGNKKLNEKRIHPTQKPTRIYEKIINEIEKRTGVIIKDVLDTNIGSESIAIVCHDLKIDLTGCELDKDYYDAAVKRINFHKRQLSLF